MKTEAREPGNWWLFTDIVGKLQGWDFMNMDEGINGNQMVTNIQTKM